VQAARDEAALLGRAPSRKVLIVVWAFSSGWREHYWVSNAIL
jgi:hypothetical protein